MFISHPQDIIEDFKKGQFVIMVDSQSRENEGDIMFAAQFADTARINFLLREARGLICLTISESQVRRLGLLPIESELHRSPQNHAAFLHSIEAASGITTGISARERAHTILSAIGPQATSTDVVVPGHVFPLQAKDGGVLVRAGHTEASVDLARLAGLNPSAVICEVLDEQGEAAKGDYLSVFSQNHGIKIGTIDDLVTYLNESAS